ncbi:MAG: asparagine synthase (glutamine-hydrolyzing) [Alphaproteobacteria bacterium]|nr:asparagine synthase (glutamine-hydrolyzing) [Alphaproteobacteria bacterium]
MCGIWFSFSREISSNVIDIIKHRGPDGSDFLKFETSFGPIFMGHRRLAIVDVSSAGHQPMEDKIHALWITYNGEIYNYKDLRQELEGFGHQFKTNTDTEVVLKSYVQWGEECLHKFSGMFSFVIYDKKSDHIFVARDPFGIKPLYYYQKGKFLAFASEIKQFTCLEDFERRIHKKRAYDFLKNGIFDHRDDTLFDEVKQIRGGECAFISLKDFKKTHSFKIKKWYVLPHPDSIQITLKDAIDQFREKFKKSVQTHLMSEVPIGFCLSGGLDSSSIVGMADYLKNTKELVTISACYNDKFFDEREFIKAVVDKTNCTSHFIFPKEEDLLTDIKKITWHQDEPFGSMSIFAQWSVFKEAHQHGLKVMLDGQGADEQLAGYLFMMPHYMKWLLARHQYIDFASFALNFSMSEPAFVLRSLKRLFNKKNKSKELIINNNYFLENEKNYSTEKNALDYLNLSTSSDIGNLCSAYVQSIHLPMLLHYEDRNSMAHSIEARVPFLDPKLVELSIGLGNSYKYKNGYTKVLIREAMKDILPSKVYKRKSKLGFSVPETKWIRGDLNHYIRNSISKVYNKFPEFFDKSSLMYYLEGSLSGSQHFDFTLWRIASFGEWSDMFDVKL